MSDATKLDLHGVPADGSTQGLGELLTQSDGNATARSAGNSRMHNRMHKWVSRLSSPRNPSTEASDKDATCSESTVQSAVRTSADRRTLDMADISTASKLPPRELDTVGGKAHVPLFDGELEYVIQMTDGLGYVGWKRANDDNAMWEKTGELRWSKDNQIHEYHGEFRAGFRHGKGFHVMPDGGRITGQFVKDCPSGECVLRDADGLYFEVVYRGECVLEDGANPISKRPTIEPVGLLHYCKYGGACPMIPLSVGPGLPLPVPGAMADQEPVIRGEYPNLPPGMRVSGELVWARPAHAQVPLWNASEVSGKIVAIMRGPPPPASGVGFAIKLYHAQLANAKAVIFVDYDTTQSSFKTIPAVLPLPDGTVVQATIPTGFILSEHSNFLQEHAHHLMIFYERDHDATSVHNVRGEVQIPVQERPARLSKEAAGELMAEFLAARRKEKEAMLRNPELIFPGTPEAVRQARREKAGFFGIGYDLFESAEFTPEAEKEALSGLFGKVGDWTAVLSETLKRATLQKNSAGTVQVYSLRGRPPFAVQFITENDDVALELRFETTGVVMNSCELDDHGFGKWGEEERVEYGSAVPEEGVSCKVSVDRNGFHLTISAQNRTLFRHRLGWQMVHKAVPDTGWGGTTEIVELRASDAEIKDPDGAATLADSDGCGDSPRQVLPPTFTGKSVNDIVMTCIYLDPNHLNRCELFLQAATYSCRVPFVSLMVCLNRLDVSFTSSAAAADAGVNLCRTSNFRTISDALSISHHHRQARSMEGSYGSANIRCSSNHENSRCCCTCRSRAQHRGLSTSGSNPNRAQGSH